jgi:hypothetical protein
LRQHSFGREKRLSQAARSLRREAFAPKPPNVFWKNVYPFVIA